MSSDEHFLEAGRRFISGSDSVTAALTMLVKAFGKFADSDSSSLYLLDPTQGVLVPHILHNFPDEYLAGCRTVALGSQCCGRAALHRQPWIVSDMWTDPLFADCQEAARNAGMRAGFSIPVLDGDRCLGTLGCQFLQPYVPSRDVLHRGQLVAILVAWALRREVEVTAEQQMASRPE